jgi:hypothetical protein
MCALSPAPEESALQQWRARAATEDRSFKSYFCYQDEHVSKIKINCPKLGGGETGYAAPHWWTTISSKLGGGETGYV